MCIRDSSQTAPIIKTLADSQEGYYLIITAPSPTFYANPLGIEIPEEYAGDYDYLNKQIVEKAAEKNMTGHFTGWPLSVTNMSLRGCVHYCMEYLDGKTNGKVDIDALQTILTNLAGEGASVTPVSYTHLDVYKRQDVIHSTGGFTGEVLFEGKPVKIMKPSDASELGIGTVSYTHLRLKQATVSRESDGSYYVSVLYEYEAAIMPQAVNPEQVIGLDYKSDGLYMDCLLYTSRCV